MNKMRCFTILTHKILNHKNISQYHPSIDTKGSYQWGVSIMLWVMVKSWEWVYRSLSWECLVNKARSANENLVYLYFKVISLVYKHYF